MKLDTELCKYEISEGILSIYYKSGVIISLADASRIINTRLELCRDETYPLLIIDEGIISMEINAWKLFASAQGTLRTSAGAFLLQSVYSCILANFFLKFVRPGVPVKVFNDKVNAMQWLQPYKSYT